MKILVQCAWCHKTMGTKTTEIQYDLFPLVTHSICPACYENLMSETNWSKLSTNVAIDIEGTMDTSVRRT